MQTASAIPGTSVFRPKSPREIRALRPDDFATLMHLEEEVFGRKGEKTLGPYYIRLCCEFFGDTCFLAEEDGRAVGYVLCMVRDREAHCTTLAVLPEAQGTRAALQLVLKLIRAPAGRIDSCWFTVKEDNHAARAIHAALGAEEVAMRDEYYGPGDRRILSRIDRAGFDRAVRRQPGLTLDQPGRRPALDAGA